MNSRDRVRMALDHSEPDRIPFDFNGTPFSGMHITALRNLRSYLGLPEVEPQILDVRTQKGVIDEDLAERLGADCRCIGLGPSREYQLVIRDEGAYVALTDEFGVGWRMPKRGGFYYDMYRHPMAEAESVADLKEYQWPDPVDPHRFNGVCEAVLAARGRGKAVALSGLSAGITERHAWLRGYINYFSDFHLNPALAEYIMDEITDMKIAYWERVLSQVGHMVDVVVEADDMAGQERVLISPDTYRRFIKPRHTRLFTAVKRRAPNARILFHTCGAIRPFVGDLIESGIDILNPVQKSAAGMDLFELKREFGRDVVFWGGGVDTQEVLPRGTPDQVRDDVRRSIEALAPGGGFVFATIHNAQADVPPENFVAMWEALQEYGRY